MRTARRTCDAARVRFVVLLCVIAAVGCGRGAEVTPVADLARPPTSSAPSVTGDPSRVASMATAASSLPAPSAPVAPGPVASARTTECLPALRPADWSVRYAFSVKAIRRERVNEKTTLALSCAPGDPLCRVVSAATLDTLHGAFQRARFSSAWEVKRAGRLGPHAASTELLARWSGGECRVSDDDDTEVAPEHRDDFSALHEAFLRALRSSKAAPAAP